MTGERRRARAITINRWAQKIPFACQRRGWLKCSFAAKQPTSASVKTKPSRHDPPVHHSLLIRREKSAIHGEGVYARVAIPADHVIVEYTGERITKAESMRREEARLARLRRGLDASTYIFHLNQRHDLDGRRGGNTSRFINHSCQPNCRSELRRGRIYIIAIKDIAPGEELTFDYGFPFREWKANPCRCGTAACAGYIVAEDQRWRLLRHLRQSPVLETPNIAPS